MASKAYGYQEGDKWVREVEYSRHFFRKYQAWGFHLHFKRTFSDPGIRGCEIREMKTGAVHWIDSATWLEHAKYNQEYRQYFVDRKHFKPTKTGRISKQQKQRVWSQ